MSDLKGLFDCLLSFLLFSTEATVAIDDVLGACVVTCGEDLNCSVEEYTARGINYFYFLEVIVFIVWSAALSVFGVLDCTSASETNIKEATHSQQLSYHENSLGT